MKKLDLAKELQSKIIQKQIFFFNKTNDNLIVELMEKGILNNKILDSIKKVPREIFTEDNLKKHIYKNIALPISCGQTISQPYVVAYMIDCLKLRKSDKVLEIGTGTGYQTALLSHLSKHVYTIEIFSKLYEQAKLNHEKLKLKNISYMLGNGVNGWKEQISFDAIIISAATKFIPIKILKNLKNDGKLIFPKKYPDGRQSLIIINKINESVFHEEKLLDVRFVPLLKKI